MSAIEYWKQRVESHHTQSQKAEAEITDSSGDFWRPYADFFKNDPRRADDEVLNRLAREVDSGDTLLDVGGGAGRFALPLALGCKRVTVVEPSESMVAGLREGASEAGIANVSVVQATWEEADMEPADVALCSHVVYGVADIEPFIRKLDAHARRKVLILSFMESPISRFSPYWKPVHGEARHDLPGTPELLSVLWEMDIYPDVEMFEPSGARGFRTREDALEQLRLRLYVKPDTQKDKRLKAAMNELLYETPNGVATRGVRPGRQALISWRPSAG